MDMLEKLLGKKQKGIQVFNIPQKKYCHDSKKLSKMEKKDLNEVISDMEKYIGHLCEKLQLGKKQFERSQQRCDELVEKSKVINSEMSRISNEHQQLQVKLTNLQNSLQIMTQQRQINFSQQLRFIEEHELTKQKIKDFNKIFQIYQNQINLCQKISSNNKQLKQKYQTLQSQYHELSQKYNKMKTTPIQQIPQKPSQQKTHPHPQQSHPQPRQPTKLQISVELQMQISSLRSTIEGKEQLILSLTKQITSQKQKLKQNQDNLQILNSDLEQILLKVGQKDQELIKFRNQNNELNNLVSNFRRNQVKAKQNEERLKEELANVGKNVEELRKELEFLKEKYLTSEDNNKKIGIQLDKFKSQNQKKENELQNIKQKLKLYEQELVSLSKTSTQLQSKQSQLSTIKKQLQKSKSKVQQQQKSIQALQQDYQVKLKKAEVTANQQRIKSDSLKRNLTILETKDEENKKDLDSMYENKIQQDGKIAQMEKKLKQYKHLIQYLKKQKIQLEKTFQSKIKNMEEMVINENSSDDEAKNNTSLTASKDIAGNSPSPRIEPGEQYEKQAIIAHKRIAELQQQVDMLREENTNLKMQKQHMLQQKQQLQANFKSLTMKREQALREIKKMSSIKSIEKGENISNQKLDKVGQSSFRKQSDQMKSKQKKIAEKAYKGFDILAKLLSSLYKAFITVSDINKKQIKEIESKINQIVRKSLDMKDIFQDYI